MDLEASLPVNLRIMVYIPGESSVVEIERLLAETDVRAGFGKGSDELRAGNGSIRWPSIQTTLSAEAERFNCTGPAFTLRNCVSARMVVLVVRRPKCAAVSKSSTSIRPFDREIARCHDSPFGLESNRLRSASSDASRRTFHKRATLPLEASNWPVLPSSARKR